MTYPVRIKPPLGYYAGQEWWARHFLKTSRVAVYWPEGPDSVTLVSYETTVSAGNAAAAAAERPNGQRPLVAINWWHSSIAQLPVGKKSHPDAREALPSWIDEAA